jgi:ferric hydroxamate transport system ATP-binding protein
MTASPETVALSGGGLTLAYDGRTVVRDAAIELRAGEVVALVGPNGSGKSTLLRALARLHTPKSGSVTLGGEQPGDAHALHPKEFARRVTLLTQSRPDPGWRTGARGRRLRPAPVPGAVRVR